MSKTDQIRAHFDAQTITVYQAYSAAIALPALQAQRFVPPFSLNRMTWIKPSFLWLMERSNWGQKTGQEYTLAIKITRAGWEEALAQGVLTHFETTVHGSQSAYQALFNAALVHVQWDPERSLRGADLGYNSIQVGISRHLIQRYIDEWIVDIEDYTPLVKKLHALLKAGQADKAKKLLPAERLYPVSASIARRLMIHD
ncbi:MAG: DUF4291 domain-containing protein [Abitibacteriaceae bacterium]|nr:DUF4291 domain-containing protein [Abditibacteriaceae bacterium]